MSEEKDPNSSTEQTDHLDDELLDDFDDLLPADDESDDLDSLLEGLEEQVGALQSDSGAATAAEGDREEDEFDLDDLEGLDGLDNDEEESLALEPLTESEQIVSEEAWPEPEDGELTESELDSLFTDNDPQGEADELDDLDLLEEEMAELNTPLDEPEESLDDLLGQEDDEAGLDDFDEGGDDDLDALFNESSDEMALDEPIADESDSLEEIDSLFDGDTERSGEERSMTEEESLDDVGDLGDLDDLDDLRGELEPLVDTSEGDEALDELDDFDEGIEIEGEGDELDSLLDDDDLDIDDDDLDLSAGLDSLDGGDSGDLLDDLIDDSFDDGAMVAAAATAGAAAAAIAAMPDKEAESTERESADKGSQEKAKTKTKTKTDGSEVKPVTKLQLAIIAAGIVLSLLMGGFAFIYAAGVSGDLTAARDRIEELKGELEASYDRDIPAVVENRSNMILLDKRVNALAKALEEMKTYRESTNQELTGLYQRYDELSLVLTDQQKEQQRLMERQRAAEAKRRDTESKVRQIEEKEQKRKQDMPWVINLSSMSSSAAAEEARKKLLQAGITNTEVNPVQVRGRTYYRVQITGFKTRDEARLYALTLPDMTEFDNAWVGNYE
ncbi:hypothetical protein D5085_09305 [Ectothiorhodospiraceae bacterium BW-2]|nr:hypothetical protein D5085_09305 [Ectothiorhodospiraceae bacterium BW-2]